MAQNPLHWGYSTWNPPTNTIPPPTSGPNLRNGQNFKRPHPDSEDCDDVFSDGSSKEHCSSPGDTDSCQMLSRKKRRGIIEKRRRDRINSSLAELRRLVPAAYEKQGSAKLEKAEILQMTVDHLKMLHSKGIDTLAYDPSKFAMEYHNIGFRECVSEVTKHLIAVECMDMKQPLHSRLVSHLQCCVAQRELASKGQAAPWYPAPNNSIANPSPSHHHNHHHPYQAASALPPPPLPHHLPIPIQPVGAVMNVQHQQQEQHQQHNTSLNTSSSDLNTSSSIGNSSYESASNDHSTPTSSVANSNSTLTSLSTISSSSALANAGYYSGYHGHHMMDLGYQQNHSSAAVQHHNIHAQQSHHSYQPNGDPSAIGSQMKPYRPWGAELAY